MTPYYSESGIEIYHGDCREILPSLPNVDLVLTDPPYGHGYDPSTGGNGVAMRRLEVAPKGFNEPFDPLWLLRLDCLIMLWGANHYADKLPASPTWLIWDKRDGIGSNDMADCEMAWSNIGGPARLFRHHWLGMLRASERGEPRCHPTQKPLALMRWCLGFAPDAETVLDPFMGSGTTLRAAKDLSRKAIGIEIEEKYCEIAAKRLSQEVLNFENVA